MDVGCGDGYFLEVAKERGWNVYGTEFTDEAIEVCSNKKINIYKGILNPQNFSGLEFDVISSFEVIEHINNPKDEIKNIINLLRKGGVFYFTTPNFNSINRLYLKNKWSIIEYPEHLSYYTKKTISALLYSNGFEKKYLKTHGLNVSEFLKKPKSNSQNKENVENLRASFESSSFKKTIKTLLNAILNTFNMGDTLKGLFVKNL